jgi:hypothetical protein
MTVGASSHQRQHVAAEAPGVGLRMAGLEDAAVDAAAEMLDERPEQPAVGLTDDEIAVEQDVSGRHAALSVGGADGKAGAAVSHVSCRTNQRVLIA